MGVPGLIITEDMVLDIQKMLESAGIMVKKDTSTNGLDTVTIPLTSGEKTKIMRVPNFNLLCENKEGERVILSFGRLTTTPYHLSIRLLPLPQSFWKTFIKREKNKLVDQIITILKENGAKGFENQEIYSPGEN